MTDHHEDHQPQRPDWRCSTCTQPWPCPLRKIGLLNEFGHHTAQLHIFMVAAGVDFLRDQPDVTGGEVYDRFLAWIGTRGTDILSAP